MYEIADLDNLAFLQIFCYVNHCNNSILNRSDVKVNTLIDLIFDKLSTQTSQIKGQVEELMPDHRALTSRFLDAQIEIQQGKQFKKGR